MRLANPVAPSTPYLTVNGAANFAQASTVTLSTNPGDFTAAPSGIEYTLLHASSTHRRRYAGLGTLRSGRAGQDWLL